jgi:hypothetical protein
LAPPGRCSARTSALSWSSSSSSSAASSAIRRWSSHDGSAARALS